jgi:spore maturation protein CgeB
MKNDIINAERNNVKNTYYRTTERNYNITRAYNDASAQLRNRAYEINPDKLDAACDAAIELTRDIFKCI